MVRMCVQELQVVVSHNKIKHQNMPSQIQITSFTGGLPAQVFVSDVYGNNNTFVGSIVSAIPPTIYFTLPSLFDFAPAVKITIIDSNGCEEFTIDECLTTFPS